MSARAWLDENLEGVLVADGFDEALIGYAYAPGRSYVAVYDAPRCIQVLEKQGMSEDEATEYFEFNVEGAWVGKGTPVFMWPIPKEQP